MTRKRYAQPADLAELALERWDTFVWRGDGHPPPPIPDAPTLSHILETVFLASLEREEGRTLRFTMCCTPSPTVDREWDAGPVPVLALQPQRSFDIANLRALAPAVNQETAAILVTYGDGHLSIAGILQLGSDLARARTGKSFFCNPPPYALTIEARNPGELHLYQASTKLCALRAGELLEQALVSALDYTPITDILSSGQDVLWPQITAPKHEPPREWAEFQFIALLNTILCVVNGMKAHAHGGTLLLTAPEPLALPISPKYGTSPEATLLGDRFVRYINARHRHADACVLLEQSERDEATTEQVADLRFALDIAERELADAAETISAFTAVDGALVMTTSLRVCGFGAEIQLQNVEPCTVYETDSWMHSKDSRQLDSESFGMRHRSATRFVGATEDTCAIIASQDGRVSFCWKRDGRVLLKRDVSTTNPNMPSA